MLQMGDELKQKRNEALIDLLRGTLEEAERGELQAIAIALVHADGATSDRFATNARVFPQMLIAALDICRHRAIDHFMKPAVIH